MGQTQFFGYGAEGFQVVITATIRSQEIPLDADTSLYLGSFNSDHPPSGRIKYQSTGRDGKGVYDFSIELVKIASNYLVGIYETGNGDIKYRLKVPGDKVALGTLLNASIDISLLDKNGKRLNYFPDRL